MDNILAFLRRATGVSSPPAGGSDAGVACAGDGGGSGATVGAATAVFVAEQALLVRQLAGGETPLELVRDGLCEFAQRLARLVLNGQSKISFATSVCRAVVHTWLCGRVWSGQMAVVLVLVVVAGYSVVVAGRRAGVRVE